MKTLVIAAIVLIGCTRAASFKVFHIPAEVLPYLTKFEYEASQQLHPLVINNLSVVFGTKTPLAQCQTGSTPLITINPDAWSYLDDTQREIVVFHELGHCILNRPHDMNYITDGGERIEESIMYPYLIDGRRYIGHRAYYLHELFWNH